MTKDAEWAFAQYERVRNVLPGADFPSGSRTISRIAEMAGEADVFLLDAFGVLNIGESVIPGAPEWVSALQGAGKRVLVVGNGASASPSASLAKFERLGFDFSPRDIIASRNVLAGALEARTEPLWGAMLGEGGALEELPVRAFRLELDSRDYDRVAGFLLLGSGYWTQEHQELLVASLARNPRPVLVGNPDIVAPREHGLTLEPGWFAHDAARRTGIVPEFFGKPFGNIFEAALKAVGDGVPRDRIVMVGDTLHTDVLGGAAIGARTVLVADHGLFKGRDVAPFIDRSGIVPDWILTSGRGE